MKRMIKIRNKTECNRESDMNERKIMNIRKNTHVHVKRTKIKKELAQKSKKKALHRIYEEHKNNIFS